MTGVIEKPPGATETTRRTRMSKKAEKTKNDDFTRIKVLFSERDPSVLPKS